MERGAKTVPRTAWVLWPRLMKLFHFQMRDFCACHIRARSTCATYSKSDAWLRCNFPGRAREAHRWQNSDSLWAHSPRCARVHKTWLQGIPDRLASGLELTKISRFRLTAATGQPPRSAGQLLDRKRQLNTNITHYRSVDTHKTRPANS